MKKSLKRNLLIIFLYSGIFWLLLLPFEIEILQRICASIIFALFLGILNEVRAELIKLNNKSEQ